ncbi:exported hypothetical protein [Sphingobacterium sp. PM2-P1-29]|nr:exported hypothetical protein [Sphingobacterium sp. PM2-P1-29]
MKRFIMVIIAMFLCFQSFGMIHMSDISDNDAEKREQEMKAKYLRIDSFANFMDSLFANKHYRKILDIYYDTTNTKFRDIKTGNAIAAYYMLGDTLRSDSIISSIVNCCNKKGKANASEAYWKLQFNNSVGWVYYLNNPYNKSKIDTLLCNILKLQELKNAKISEKILLMYVNDQYCRNQTDIYYWNISGTRRVPRLFEIDSIRYLKMQKQTADDVFKLLQESKRIYGKEEIGTDYAFYLLFLLIHEDDMTRRDYYLKLIKEGVKTGVCTKSNIINFILRTEYIQAGPEGLEKYTKGLDARIAELVKEYDVQNYSFNSW